MDVIDEHMIQVSLNSRETYTEIIELRMSGPSALSGFEDIRSSLESKVGTFVKQRLAS